MVEKDIQILEEKELERIAMCMRYSEDERLFFDLYDDLCRKGIPIRGDEHIHISPLWK